MAALLVMEPASVPSRGAMRHWLVLALAGGPEAPANGSPGRRGADAQTLGAGRRVLVVDDEPEMLELTRMLLEGTFPGLVVDAAQTGVEALRLVESRSYDAVLSDYRMPLMDGLEFLIQAAKRIPQDRRILMTAFADKGLQQRARQAGLAFIEKAGDPQNVVDAVRRALSP